VATLYVLHAHVALSGNAALLGEDGGFGGLQLGSELCQHQGVGGLEFLLAVDDEVEALGQESLQHAAQIF